LEKKEVNDIGVQLLLEGVTKKDSRACSLFTILVILMAWINNPMKKIAAFLNLQITPFWSF